MTLSEKDIEFSAKETTPENSNQEIIVEEKEPISKSVISESEPPITPFGLVGVAWALASKEDANNSQSAQKYIVDLIKKYEQDEKAKQFFKGIMPILYGVIAKLAYARKQATGSFERIEDIKKNQLNGLEQISSLGSSLQGIISRIVGVAAGGSIGFLTSFGQDEPTIVPISTLLGVAIGYGVIEITLQIYKVLEGRRIIEKKWSSKEATWDREFTLETHRASLLLYREAGKAIQKIYNKRRTRVRRESKEFQKMTEMFMQKPSIEHSSAAKVIDFLRTCTEIEWQMAEFINTFDDLKIRFGKLKNPDNPKKVEPFERGFRGLSSFLLSEKILDDELYDQIMKIRKRRIKLFFHDDYSGFDIKLKKKTKDSEQNVIDLAPEVLDLVITTLENYSKKHEKTR